MWLDLEQRLLHRLQLRLVLRVDRVSEVLQRRALNVGVVLDHRDLAGVLLRECPQARATRSAARKSGPCDRRSRSCRSRSGSRTEKPRGTALRRATDSAPPTASSGSSKPASFICEDTGTPARVRSKAPLLVEIWVICAAWPVVPLTAVFTVRPGWSLWKSENSFGPYHCGYVSSVSVPVSSAALAVEEVPD